MQNQTDHTDRIYETKIVEEEPVHPMMHNDHKSHAHHKDEVILESHVNDIHHKPQQN